MKLLDLRSPASECCGTVEVRICNIFRGQMNLAFHLSHLSTPQLAYTTLQGSDNSYTMSNAVIVNAGSKLPPSHTLYCSNLPDKLQKDDLKQALYMLFSTYGSILDIVALKTAKMRGQAHVLFRDVQASIQAMTALQGFEFFGKTMVRPQLISLAWD